MPDKQPTEQPRRSPLTRPGCIVALVIWFIVLLTPCFFIILAAQGEISITTGAAPEQRLRVWLIQDADQSGIGLSTVSVHHNDEALCVQTNVSFVLWRGETQPTTQYCECYLQVDDGYQTTSISQGECAQP